MAYASNVFINFPFDSGYKPIIERMIFILCFYEFNVQMSVNKSSAHDRLTEIGKMIKDSKFTFHDLSRHKLSKKEEYARFNMPFELGIDIGCYQYLGSKTDKVIAMIDSDPHAYDRHLSDMSGRDILYHYNKPELLFEIIPNWLTVSTGELYDSPKRLSGYFGSWIVDYKATLKNNGYDLRKINKIPLSTYHILLKKWIPQWKVANGY